MDSTGLVRELTPPEVPYEIWNRSSTFLVGYERRLASVKPLDVDLVRKALELLHKYV